jgi:cell division septation protein DedD
VKERLTGAIILVALIVLLVPALLTGPIRSAPQMLAAASSASAEEPPLRSYTIHLADDARAHTAARASGPEQPAPIGAPAGAESTAPAVAAPAVATPASAAATPPAVRAPAPAAAAIATVTPPSASASSQSGTWMVQLGSFASRANAERLAQQLRARGFQMSVSQGSTGRRLYRVRAGPAASRAAAVQLAAKLHAAGHAGAIVAK